MIDSNRVELSVVVPMYNEAENVVATVTEISRVVDGLGVRAEIVCVDDGSTDSTLERLAELAKEHEILRIESHQRNFGRGKALRTGFATARGEIIVTLDADLTYSAEHIALLYRKLEAEPGVDVVVGSPYCRGGRTESVPPFRLLVSKLGNVVVGRALGGHVKTVTGILRGYRRHVIESLELESDGKEIHLEILSKALANGFNVCELPATLTFRRHGRSKFRFRATSASHLLFSLSERPMMLFGAIGILFGMAGLALGVYFIYLWRRAQLNPERPLMTLMVLLIVTGMQILILGFIGTQIVSLRKEIYKVQRENLSLKKRLDEMAKD